MKTLEKLKHAFEYSVNLVSIHLHNSHIFFSKSHVLAMKTTTAGREARVSRTKYGR